MLDATSAVGRQAEMTRRMSSQPDRMVLPILRSANDRNAPHASSGDRLCCFLTADLAGDQAECHGRATSGTSNAVGANVSNQLGAATRDSADGARSLATEACNLTTLNGLVCIFDAQPKMLFYNKAKPLCQLNSDGMLHRF